MLAYADQQAQNLTLKAIINDYIETSKIVQRVANPSGDFETLEGLGEPKFQVDGKPFNDNWGRPQRDGPALRSIAIINFINTQVQYNASVVYEDFKEVYSDVLRPDLQYVAQKWMLDGFDLWEEVRGLHFFTSMAHRRALIMGAQLARNIGAYQDADMYDHHAERLRDFIESRYYDSSRGHLVETLGHNYRSGLDSALFLGSIHGLDLLKWSGHPSNTSLFEPYSDEVIASLVHYIASMRYRYPINIARLNRFEASGFNASAVGIAVGRYPEDVYNGVGTSLGNPWFLCTSTVAHTLYLLADYLHTRPADFQLHITSATLPLYAPFLADFDCSTTAGSPFACVVHRSSPRYTALVSALVSFGDSFLDVVREHHDQNTGDMSEQFSRYDGYMRGAEKLTWSYGAFWGAVRQRGLLSARMAA